MRRRAACLLLALGLASAVAGCGGSSAPPRHSARLAERCTAEVRAAVGRAGGGGPADARVASSSPGMTTCLYTAPRIAVRVLVDTNPQAEQRFDRAVVERDQNAIWSSHHGRAPRLLHGIGEGADWFPDDRNLLTTDGRALIDITVHSPRSPARALRLAKRVAHAVLAH
jgi:hypothetical protein